MIALASVEVECLIDGSHRRRGSRPRTGRAARRRRSDVPGFGLESTFSWCFTDSRTDAYTVSSHNVR
jgi:hypothetical protein